MIVRVVDLQIFLDQLGNKQQSHGILASKGEDWQMQVIQGLGSLCVDQQNRVIIEEAVEKIQKIF